MKENLEQDGTSAAELATVQAIDEEVVLMLDEMIGPSLFEQFHDGLSEGMFALGVAFPFLFLSALVWFATILWVPFAIRLARRTVKAVIGQKLKGSSPDIDHS